jgi:membrane-bound serine protease (ClpP class)
METLLNPNIAYLALLSGTLMAILALFVPGTGLLEIAAVFVLLLAGWEVYGLLDQLNLWALVLLILGVFPFFLAVRKSGRMIYLLGAILALVVGSIFLFRDGKWWQPAVDPILAVVGSTLATLFMWIGTRKSLEAVHSPPTHLKTLIGSVGEVASEIKADSEGTVQLESELWSARSTESIPVGSEVKVIGREGFTLIVEKVNKDHL